MIETDRLFMSRSSRVDLPSLIENRSPAAVNRHLGEAVIQSPEALSNRLDLYTNCHESHGVGMCAIGLKETGKPFEQTGEIEVGYDLAERFWRQRYGYESAMEWLAYGIDVMGIETIVAVCHPENIGSFKIMDKCGLLNEKTDWRYVED